jgi:hypothetical protein
MLSNLVVYLLVTNPFIYLLLTYRFLSQPSRNKNGEEKRPMSKNNVFHLDEVIVTQRETMT